MVKNEKYTENYHKKIGLFTSLIVHLLIFLLLLFSPDLKRNLPPPGYEGIMVRFGDPDSPPIESSELSKNLQEAPQSTEQEDIKKNQEQKIDLDNQLSFSEKSKISIREKEVKNTPNQSNKPTEKINKEDFSKFFSKNSGKSGNQSNSGDPLGSKDSDILEGISKGKGKVGDGLDARGIRYEPNFSDSSQKSGTVVVRICLDANGKVISAKYTQKGSTTSDSDLVAIAVNNCKKYVFAPSSIPEQCGTVSVTFIVR